MASSKPVKTPPAKPLPADALEALRQLCATTTQAEVARRLGVSDASISGALKGRYIGNVERLAERVRGELLNAKVTCPELGDITTRICQDEREKPFHTASPMRVRIWRACQACPNNPKGVK